MSPDRDDREPGWPSGMDVRQVRFARPTDRLAEVVRFYREGLGLSQLDSFAGHAGYDGVMLGLPGRSCHLEFTQHVDGSPGPAPTRDNLLVFYIPHMSSIEAITERLRAMGYPPVPAENPYWNEARAVPIEDPDGWRIVLVPSNGI